MDFDEDMIEDLKPDKCPDCGSKNIIIMGSYTTPYVVLEVWGCGSCGWLQRV